MINKIFGIPLYPFIFAPYPFLFLLSRNPDELYMSDILFPAAAALSCTAIFLLALLPVLKNPRKAGLITFTLMILFFSYGHAREILMSSKNWHLKTWGDWYLMSLWIIIFTAVLVFTSITALKLKSLTRILNCAVLSLLIISAVSLAFSGARWTPEYSVKISGMPEEIKTKLKMAAAKDSGKNLPDIYHIILDGYAGQESLKKIFNYDNSPFLNYLKSRNFFVASKGRSNYAHTLLSLASSLNMTYINDLIEKDKYGTKNTRKLQAVIHDNELLRFLKGRGYTAININTCTTYTYNNPYADINIDPVEIKEFTLLVVQTTMIAPFAHRLDFFNKLRRAVLVSFDLLSHIPEIEGPTYTFAHILPPHPPYIFKRNGAPLRSSEIKTHAFPWHNRERYIDQLVFINSLVVDTVEKILQRSARPPIIVIQADHGPASLLQEPGKGSWYRPTDEMLKERFDILNVLFLPEKGTAPVSEAITPVNTFRVILNEYFDLDAAVLPDRIYYSSDNRMFELKDVTESVVTE